MIMNYENRTNELDKLYKEIGDKMVEEFFAHQAMNHETMDSAMKIMREHNYTEEEMTLLFTHLIVSRCSCIILERLERLTEDTITTN